VAPLHIARTTSLIVVPLARPTPRIRSIGQSSAANRRDPVIRWLKIVRGANSDTAEVSLRIPRDSVRTSAPGSPAASALMPRAVRNALTGTPSRRSSASPLGDSPRAGAGPAAHGGGMSLRDGSVDSVAWVSRIDEMPSTSAWCILVYIATRPSRRPSMTCASHSGRSRASRVPCSREHSSRSSRTRPGFGSALCRTWYSRSNSSSLVHTH